jgi:hypothetical protein
MRQAAMMLTRPDDLQQMLVDAASVRVRWVKEARRAIKESDDDREVACEYQLCLIDGLIALIRRELLH